MRVGLVTCRALPELGPDDRALLPALERLGIAPTPVVWDDPARSWRACDALVLRSCWDYYLDPAGFRSWLADVAAHGIMAWNPVDVARWNMDKRYLRDLEARGVALPRSVWIDAGAKASLADALAELGVDDAVLKPTVSATAWRTRRTSRDTARADQRHLDEILERSGALVQEFVPEVRSDGEWSLVFVDGALSHAVLKRPSPDDFRVQADFGGRAVACEAPDRIVARAESALRAAGRSVLYARVDGIERAGELLILEIELIEPQLFFRLASGAAERFARALARRLDGPVLAETPAPDATEDRR